MSKHALVGSFAPCFRPWIRQLIVLPRSNITATMKPLITALTIFFSSTCFSQTNVLVYSGINFPAFPLRLKESSFFLTRYWENGLNFGASLELKLSNSLFLSPGFEYNLYPFDSYDGPINRGIISTIFVKSADGEKSKIYRFLLEIKHFTEASADSKSQPFLSTGFGYIVEDIGNIDVLWGDISGPDVLIKEKFDGKSYFVNSEYKEKLMRK